MEQNNTFSVSNACIKHYSNVGFGWCDVILFLQAVKLPGVGNKTERCIFQKQSPFSNLKC